MVPIKATMPQRLHVASTIKHTVIPQRKIRGCDWSKSRHVTFTKTH